MFLDVYFITNIFWHAVAEDEKPEEPTESMEQLEVNGEQENGEEEMKMEEPTEGTDSKFNL